MESGGFMWGLGPSYVGRGDQKWGLGVLWGLLGVWDPLCRE